MIDVADFGAMVTSLRAVADLAKLVVDAHDAGVRREKSIELQRQIVTALESAVAAQVAQSALLKRVNELEKTVADLEAWDAEKQKYELVKLKQYVSTEHAGAFAYALKEGVSPSEPKHFICPNCYEQRHKSILQPVMLDLGKVQILFCPRCRTEINLTGISYPTAKGRAGRL